jgi:hypothetical protein
MSKKMVLVIMGLGMAAWLIVGCEVIDDSFNRDSNDGNVDSHDTTTTTTTTTTIIVTNLEGIVTTNVVVTTNGAAQ